MPEDQERALRRSLKEQHPDWPESRIDHVVYGHLHNEGWKPDGHRSNGNGNGRPANGNGDGGDDDENDENDGEALHERLDTIEQNVEHAIEQVRAEFSAQIRALDGKIRASAGAGVSASNGNGFPETPPPVPDSSPPPEHQSERAPRSTHPWFKQVIGKGA